MPPPPQTNELADVYQVDLGDTGTFLVSAGSAPLLEVDAAAGRVKVNGIALDASIEEVYGPDLVTGDSRFFEGGTVGHWTATPGGDVVANGGNGIVGSSWSLMFTPTDAGQTLELAIPGTFLANHRYAAMLVGSGVFLGSIGDFGESDLAAFPHETLEPYTYTEWVPQADRSNVSIRLASTDDVSALILFYARVVEIVDGARVLPGSVHVGGDLYVRGIQGVDTMAITTSLSIAGKQPFTNAAISPGEVGDPPNATAEDVAVKLNALINALLDASLLVSD